MAVIIHIVLFLLSAGVVWFFAGMLIEAIDRVAKRFNQSGFTVAFFVLGFLTSISELSVMVNATLNKTPQVSAGNLAGASLVIILFLIPFLAIANRGIRLKNTLSRRHLALSLLVTLLPVLVMLDGNVTRQEGIACVLAYGTLLYLIRKYRSGGDVPEIIEEVGEDLISKQKATAMDAVKIAIGGAFIFLAGHLLVDETVYFARALSVPSSIIALLVLSIGTNVPELVVAIRSITKKHADIAFGDYLGSAVANTPIFGMLGVLNGKFTVEPSEFLFTAMLMTVGFIAFYVFARSRNQLSKKEGMWLISLYGLFVFIQLLNVVRFILD